MMQLPDQSQVKSGNAPKKPQRKFNEKVFEEKKTDCPAELKPKVFPEDFQLRRLQAKSVHRQATYFALLNSLLTLLVIICAYLGNEAEFSGLFNSFQSSALRILIIAVSAVQIFLTTQGAKLKLALTKLSGDIHYRSTA